MNCRMLLALVSTIDSSECTRSSEIYCFVRRPFMEVLNQDHVRRELIQLREKQVSTLERQKFVGLTEAELRQFKERQRRIRDLFIELHHLDWAA
jgi:hypothetical protein